LTYLTNATRSAQDSYLGALRTLSQHPFDVQPYRSQLSTGAPTWRADAEKHLRWAALNIERAAIMMKRIGGPLEKWMDGEGRAFRDGEEF
jgi:hypothetical protein